MSSLIIDEKNKATLVLNIAAMIILLGLYIFSSVYRRRRKPDDRLFSCMLLDVLIICMSDSVTHIADGCLSDIARVLNLVCNYIYYLGMEIFIWLFTWYLAVRFEQLKGKKLKIGKLIMIPAFIECVLILLNPVFEYFFRINWDENRFYNGDYYRGIYIAWLVYLVITLVLIVFIDVRALLIFLMVFGLRYFYYAYEHAVCSNAICFTIGLVFVSIHRLGAPFFEENDVRTIDKEGEEI